jgi:hypothetical protein
MFLSSMSMFCFIVTLNSYCINTLKKEYIKGFIPSCQKLRVENPGEGVAQIFAKGRGEGGFKALWKNCVGGSLFWHL